MSILAPWIFLINFFIQKKAVPGLFLYRFEYAFQLLCGNPAQVQQSFDLDRWCAHRWIKFCQRGSNQYCLPQWYHDNLCAWRSFGPISLLLLCRCLSINVFFVLTVRCFKNLFPGDKRVWRDSDCKNMHPKGTSCRAPVAQCIERLEWEQISSGDRHCTLIMRRRWFLSAAWIVINGS